MQTTPGCPKGTSYFRSHRRLNATVAAFFSLTSFAATGAIAQSPNVHASAVIAHDDKGQLGGGVFNPRNLLGPIEGQVHSLGIGGYATVGFDVKIVNGPGADFIVTENPFFYGQPGESFAEMVFVEVSSDGVTFARIPSRYMGAPTQPGPFGVVHVGSYEGMAGATPRNPSTTDQQDVVLAGGDALDLEDLAQDPLVLTGKVNLNAITQIRFVDVQSGIDKDSRGVTVYDPGGGSADIDGVAVIHHDKNASAHKPEVDVIIPSNGQLEIIVRDPDGIGDLDPQTLRLALFGKELPFGDLLPFMQVVSVDPLGFHLRLRTALPQGFLLRVSVSVKDRAKHRSGDTRSR